MTATSIGTTTGSFPEMTGNANAELWGFVLDAAMPRVVQFDKTNGSFPKNFAEPTPARNEPGLCVRALGR